MEYNINEKIELWFEYKEEDNFYCTKCKVPHYLNDLCDLTEYDSDKIWCARCYGKLKREMIEKSKNGKLTKADKIKWNKFKKGDQHYTQFELKDNVCPSNQDENDECQEKGYRDVDVCNDTTWCPSCRIETGADKYDECDEYPIGCHHDQSNRKEPDWDA